MKKNRLNEDVEAQNKPEGADIKKDDLLNLKYQEFTTKLQEIMKNDKDGKVKALISAGTQDGNKVEDAFEVEWNVPFPVTSLKPLQNEIDADGSLLFPLSGKSNNLIPTLKGEAVKILGPVVVYNDGSNDWIIDGHHRWSGVYTINKDAKVIGCRLKSKVRVSPGKVLRAAQLAIASLIGKVPTSDAKGTNLMTVEEQKLKDYVKTGAGSLKGFTGIKEDTIKQFSSVKEELNSADSIANFIWNNILSMRKTSGEYWKKLNIKRDFMPQTDLGAEGTAKDSETTKTVKQMMTGSVDWTPPFKESRLIKTFESFIKSKTK